jgi:DNA polymerase-3 subunit gamma/tau
MLTKEGANAFLKTLEEPPPYAVFILATTAPEALPPTILSRCQRYAFRRIPIETMIDRMRTIATAEGITVDDAALGAIAYRADGGLRDALTMLEQVAAFASNRIDLAAVDAAFGQTGREFAQRLLASALDGDAPAALVAIDDASDAGTDMTGLIRGVIAEFRHLLVARVNPALLSRDLSADDSAAALARAEATPQARLVRALRLFADALAAARGSGNARLELETALLRFILQAEDPTLDALAQRVAALEGGDRPAPVSAPPRPSAPAPVPAPARAAVPQSPPKAAVAPESVPVAPAPPPPAPVAERVAPAPEPVTPAKPPAAAAELSLQKVRSLWSNVRTRAESEKVSLRAVLSRATVAALEGDVLTLRVPDSGAAELLRGNLPTLRKAIDEVLGRSLTISIGVESARASDPAPDHEGDDDPSDLMRYALKKFG